MAHPRVGHVYLVLGIAIVAVSLAAIFIRLADAPGVVIAGYRMILASLVLLPWSLHSLRRTRVSRDTLLYAGLAGLFLGAHFATWITSLSYTSVAASATLVSTSPLWIALFSWLFLGMAPSLSVLLGILLSVAGGAMIGFGDLLGGNEPILGDALALLGAISISAYFLLGRVAQRRGLTLNGYIGIAYGVAALVLLPLPALLGKAYVGYSIRTLFWIVMLALVPQLIGHTGINFAMKKLSPTLVATLTLLEPIGASLLALMIFGEIPSGLTVLGGVLLLFGVATTTRRIQVGAGLLEGRDG